MNVSRMISDIRIFLPARAPGRDKNGVLAFVNLTLCDAFVIRDIRIISIAGGRTFVAMPSAIRKGDRCPNPDCCFRNSIQANFCSECGEELPPPQREQGHNQSDYLDLIFPLNAEARTAMEGAILSAYHQDMRDRRLGNVQKPEVVPISSGVHRPRAVAHRNEQFEILD